MLIWHGGFLLVTTPGDNAFCLRKKAMAACEYSKRKSGALLFIHILGGDASGAALAGYGHLRFRKKESLGSLFLSNYCK